DFVRNRWPESSGIRIGNGPEPEKRPLLWGRGGNFFTDLLSGGDDTPARVRVREAVALKASVLAVACPICAIMLEDAVKAENLEEALTVREASEIVMGRMDFREA
ncbi:MAG: hypothetical protein Q7U02_09970, partial [Desulfosalsimonadaceae bacterium]|nr:hypothetical protein [Desulfosalsimonadaceae bacterium]